MKIYINWEKMQVLTEKEYHAQFEKDVDAMYENNAELEEYFNANYCVGDVIVAVRTKKIESYFMDYKDYCMREVQEAYDDDYEEFEFENE